MMKSKILSELGFSDEARVLLLNHDDLGMNYGSNIAFQELLNEGTVKSGSVMVPCPWFPHFIELYIKNRNFSVGVHLTLTSEWGNYRWKPLSTVDVSSGLIDSDGYFWKNRQLLRQHLNKQAAEVEFRAQIDRALDSGIDVTHLDCHMGVGLVPELIDIYLKLGNEYKVPVLLPKSIIAVKKLYKIDDVNDDFYTDLVAELEVTRYPLVDNFTITPCFPAKEAEKGYENLLLNIPHGVTFFSLHPNTSDSIKLIDPVMYHARIDEYRLFSKIFNENWLSMHGIKVISFKEIRNMLRKKQ
ncbi:hypothetical protein COX03_02285 [Candidatus Woesebacteria bacterium CG22_combo_CG10-13_8_21_14_all_39_10]|uniref:ChbG/HpnK family deacetylase n=2 Tax=Candidatus Woeseibacteriota TaxID=1752722 RepID=A0A2H0BIZ2_9BACT|nr:MAG: hypothetical protein COX03_02285 [Candidatus Woesebacteria bacterium CG22_combo_CG10-13_8_21_14_all_39_10]PIZ48431.1 MAG: hypothetical protein COY29_03810 [Candidatus Woesebacteria bacterium CG_4_10_14_0_2_um_filter_39_14]